MKKKTFSIALIALLILFTTRCTQSNSQYRIATDTASIATGTLLFNSHCAACHNFRKDGIGPQLAGITEQLSPEHLRNFIKNPQKLIAAGNERAIQVQEKFKGATMPAFEFLNDEELDALLAFIHSKKPGEPSAGLVNPIPDTIALSDLVVQLTHIATFPATDTGKPRTRITKLDYEPRSGALFVVDLNGVLYRLKNSQPEPYLDIRKQRPGFVYKPGLASGFGSFAFHPSFGKNGLLYTTHTEAPGSGPADFPLDTAQKTAVQWVLSEWKTNTPSGKFSGRELLRAEMPGTVHGVQEITFNPYSTPGDEDYGLLYIGIGDGGKSSLAAGSGIWGTILRIDPAGKNSVNKKYGISPNNPFVKNQQKPAEVYAYGFRNAHRITWTASGKMLVSNVGQEHVESLSLIKPGNNYGWPTREGTFKYDNINGEWLAFPLPPDDSLQHITYPVAQFDHDEGHAISGGFEYTGKSIPALKGKFLFGDIPDGRLFYVEEADLVQGKQAIIKEWRVSLNNEIQSLEKICGSKRVDLHFGKDKDGDLYILTKPDGNLYKITGTL